MNTFDGFIRNLFPTTKEISKDKHLLPHGSWFCENLNSDPETANACIVAFMETTPQQAAKMRFLYDCKSCITYALEDIDLMDKNKNYFTGCCGWVKNCNSKEELEQIKGIYQAALIKIDKAICLYNECDTLDCDEKEQNIFSQLPNSQKVLLYYYGLKSIGFEFRKTSDIAPIARLMHLLFGEEYTTSNNSDFYKKLLVAPNVKKNKSLITDLEAIKPLFAKVGMKDAIQLINTEIKTCRNELKIKPKQAKAKI